MRNFFARLRSRLQRLMWGRYGVDQLGLFLLGASVLLSFVGLLLSRLLPHSLLAFLLPSLLAYGLLAFYLFRVFSKNLDARRRENRRFLCCFRRFRDRENRYYRCPNCKQAVRVPRGRGKICIKCPKCSEKFIRKS